MPSWTRVRVSGVLAPYASSFGKELRRHGYTELTTARQLGSMAHLSDWMSRHGLERLSREDIVAFCADRRAAGHSARVTPGSLASLQQFLQEQGLLTVDALRCVMVEHLKVADAVQRYDACDLIVGEHRTGARVAAAAEDHDAPP